MKLVWDFVKDFVHELKGLLVLVIVARVKASTRIAIVEES